MDNIGVISLIISSIMMGISILTFSNAVKERHTKSATESAELAIKLDNVIKDVADMREELNLADSGYHKNDKRITNLETRCDNLERRMGTLEKEVRNVRN